MLNRKTMDVVLIILTALLAVAKAIRETDELANLDGICEVPDVGRCIFEAKTASAYKIGEWEDSIPDEYQIQIQHYMAVTGYKGTYETNSLRPLFVVIDLCPDK